MARAARRGLARSLAAPGDIDVPGGAVGSPSSWGGSPGATPGGSSMRDWTAVAYTPTFRAVRESTPRGRALPAPDTDAVLAAASAAADARAPGDRARLIGACDVLRRATTEALVASGAAACLASVLCECAADGEVVAAAAEALCAARGAFEGEVDAVGAVGALLACAAASSCGSEAFAACVRALSAIGEDATLAPAVGRALVAGGAVDSVIVRGLLDATEASGCAAARLVAVLCRPSAALGAQGAVALSAAPALLPELRVAVAPLLGLTAGGRAASARREAAAAVASLARHMAGRALLMEAGGVPRLLQCLADDDATVRLHSVGAIASFAEQRGVDSVDDGSASGLGGAAVEALVAFVAGSVGVPQEQALLALSRLAAAPASHAAIASSRLRDVLDEVSLGRATPIGRRILSSLRAIVQAMRVGPGGPGASQSALSVDGALRILSAGCVGVRVLEAAAAIVGVELHSTTDRGPATRAALARDARAVAMLCRLLQLGLSPARERACTALSALVGDASLAGAAFAAGLIPSLVSGMRSPLVPVRATCAALACTIASAPHARAALADSAAVKALVALLAPAVAAARGRGAVAWDRATTLAALRAVGAASADRALCAILRGSGAASAVESLTACADSAVVEAASRAATALGAATCVSARPGHESVPHAQSVPHARRWDVVDAPADSSAREASAAAAAVAVELTASSAPSTDDWVACTDDATGRVFFYSATRDESVWEKPPYPMR